MIDLQIKNYTPPQGIKVGCEPCYIKTENGVTVIRLFWEEKEFKNRLQKVVNLLLTTNEENDIKVLKRSSEQSPTKVEKIPLGVFRRKNNYNVK